MSVWKCGLKSDKHKPKIDNEKYALTGTQRYVGYLHWLNDKDKETQNHAYSGPRKGDSSYYT